MPSALTWKGATSVPVGLDTLEMEHDVQSPVSYIIGAVLCTDQKWCILITLSSSHQTRNYVKVCV